MNFHLAAWASSQAAGASNADNALVSDVILGQRNSHMLTTDPLKLRAAWAIGASITDARFDSPSLSIPTRFHIAPGLRSATVPSRPTGIQIINEPLDIPLQEEIATQLSNNLGAASENEFVIALLTPPYWDGSFRPGVPMSPMGPSKTVVKFTATVVVTNLAYSAAVAITPQDTLKGGWYALRWGQCQATGAIAVRFIFPRQRTNARRPWRPGFLCSQALGDQPEEFQWYGRLGDLGFFHSSELPQIEVLSVTGGGTAVTMFLGLTYIGPGDPAQPIPGIL